MPTTITIPVLTLGELAPAVQAHFGRTEAFRSGPPPAEPGCYAWSCGKEEAVVYLGSAASLANRLGDYARWIGGHDPDSAWAVSVVHMLHHLGARVQWLPTASHGEALELERRLIEWHRACVGAAPPVVGWEAKPGSPRSDAERWARRLRTARRGRTAGGPQPAR